MIEYDKNKRDVGSITYCRSFDLLIQHIESRFTQLGFDIKYPEERQILLIRNIDVLHPLQGCGTIRLDFFKYHDHITINYTFYDQAFLSILVALIGLVYLPICLRLIYKNPTVDNIVKCVLPLIVVAGIFTFQRISNRNRLFRFVKDEVLPQKQVQASTI